MSNNNQRNGNNGNGGYNPNQFKQQELQEGLFKVPDTSGLIGLLFNKRKSGWEDDIQSMFISTYGVSECSNVSFLPLFNRGEDLPYDVLCRAFFDTLNAASGMITRVGSDVVARPNGHITTIFDLGGTNAFLEDGDFNVSEEFKKLFGALSVNPGRELQIRQVPNKPHVACVDLDWRSVMCLRLGIQDNDPYNFTVIKTEPITDAKNEIVDYFMMISKFISTDNRRKKNAERNKSNVDYEELNRHWANSEQRQYNGGNRGNRRRF